MLIAMRPAKLKIRYVSEKPCLSEVGRHFILNFQFAAISSKMRQVFTRVYVFVWTWWIRWGTLQLRFMNLTIIKEVWYEVCMRISNPQSESFVEVSLENVENFRWSWKAVPLYKKPWGSMGARKNILEFIVSLPDEGGRFISFSVFHFIFENFDSGRKVDQLLGSGMGD